MLVTEAIIQTKVVNADMLVAEVFAECGRAHVQALPFVNEAGEITGRVTLKNIMKYSCLPDYMVETASMLGNFLSCVDNAEEKIKKVLCTPITDYVRQPHATIASDAPAIKALAMMEKNDTSYIFVVDAGEYRGIITIQGIAAAMSRLGVCETGAA